MLKSAPCNRTYYLNNSEKAFVACTFKPKMWGKCAVEKCQLYQPKPAVVETVDQNSKQPHKSNSVAQDARERV